MSRLWRCNTCGGLYVDPQPDGTRYFHACPPTGRAEPAAPATGRSKRATAAPAARPFVNDENLSGAEWTLPRDLGKPEAQLLSYRAEHSVALAEPSPTWRTEDN